MTCFNPSIALDWVWIFCGKAGPRGGPGDGGAQLSAYPQARNRVLWPRAQFQIARAQQLAPMALRPSTQSTAPTSTASIQGTH